MCWTFFQLNFFVLRRKSQTGYSFQVFIIAGECEGAFKYLCCMSDLWLFCHKCIGYEYVTKIYDLQIIMIFKNNASIAYLLTGKCPTG